MRNRRGVSLVEVLVVLVAVAVLTTLGFSAYRAAFGRVGEFQDATDRAVRSASPPPAAGPCVVKPVAVRRPGR